jgi:glucose/mannose-6-phosphate isomerase
MGCIAITPSGREKMSEGIVRLAEALDDENMIGHTRSFVDDIKNGLDMMQRNLHPWLHDIAGSSWQGVLCLGMGGSAAGGDFLSILCDRFGTLPVKTSRSYEIPAWWNEQHLIIATSHSGNTEETISAVEIAANNGGTIIVISSGGVLSGLSELHENVHLISSPGGQPPRTAFGHLFSRQLALLNQLDILPEMIDDEMISRLQTANESCDIIADPEGSIASLALSLMEHDIALLGPNELHPALVRMKNQFNENSARFARIGVVPEMNHNEIVAWGGIGDNSDPKSSEQGLLILTWDAIGQRVEQRMDWFVANCPTETAWRIHGEGETLIEALLHLCITMDWLSIALGLLHGKDPAGIEPIHALKAHLQSVD